MKKYKGFSQFTKEKLHPQILYLQETENSSLKEELENLKIKNATLFEENAFLKSICDKDKEKKRIFFICSNCNKAFENQEDFKNHKTEHKRNNDVFKCNKCEKTYNEDWKMNAQCKSVVKVSNN